MPDARQLTRSFRTRISVDLVLTQLVDEDAHILRVIDRRGDEMNAATFECMLKRRREIVRTLHTASLDAVGRCISDEVRITEAHAEIGIAVDGLFPADHAIGVVL